MKRKLLFQQQAPPSLIDDVPGLYTTIPPLFDICGRNDLISLSLSNVNPLLDWIGWVGTKTWKLVRDFILYQRAAVAPGGGPSAGWMTDPCLDPNGTEWAKDQLEIHGFARLGRGSPVRDTTMTGMNYCEISPRYAIDGRQIVDDTEYDIIRAAEVLIKDILYQVLMGNSATPGQMDGLPQLVNDAYTNPMLDSVVVDWNGLGMDGGAGATFNGRAIPTNTKFVYALYAVIRRIVARISMVPSIRANALTYGDVVICMPRSFIDCLLNAITCWHICGGDYTLLNSKEALAYRESMNGGPFGVGEIVIDGLRIPILPVDQLITGFSSFTMYILTRGVGNWRWLYGQYNDMDPVAALTAQKTGLAYNSIDNGMVLNWSRAVNTCLKQFVETMPRLIIEAPWAQAVIEDIHCDALGGPLSDDPWSDYFPYNEAEDRPT